ncbi:MAG: PD40 domain-containing protein, partial [Muriicola sp.]|nr:PD40 domain-containing protein [Muriicola sp.]
MKKSAIILFFSLICLHVTTGYSQKKPFDYLDVFDLQYVSDPQISPDGNWIVYRRMGFDIMTDRAKGNLWMIRKDGSRHQKLTSREVSESSPRWSPNG